ncbi:Gp19/Gp15/Gp42-like protein [Corynebacterium mucifaciens]
MATLVTVDEIAAVLPTGLEPGQEERVGALIELAEEEIALAFARRGRSFQNELAASEWLEMAARRAVREMVSAAVIIGPNAGVRSVSSTTGPQSDSITYADVDAVSFGGVVLTDKLLELLGLAGVRPRGRFPRPARWPEEGVHRGRNTDGCW